jgi:8-amino-7-oxononanoate synthase
MRLEKEFGKKMICSEVGNMNQHWEELKKELEQIRSKNLFRECKVTDGLDFCSNDYLGLASSEGLKSALIKNASLFSTGSTASRLVKGHRSTMAEWEGLFSAFVHSEASLIVANGYVANMGLIDTIANTQTIVFTDRLNHASILDGIRISGAIKKYYNHLDLEHLESQLIKIQSSPDFSKKKKIIVSETLFSMDGDSPNMKKLVELKDKYDCILILDEAHALGVFGNDGRGMCFESLTEEEIKKIEYRVYTLGKALGLEGGVIATSNVGRDFLVNRMRPFIFSTAPLPLIAATAKEALRMLSEANEDRIHLMEIAKYFKATMEKIGFHLSPSISHIIPVLMESEREALIYSESLRARGFDIRAIRPPTVPTARLRISLNSQISQDSIEALVKAMIAIREERQGQKGE